MMKNNWNVVLLITDGHGHFTKDMDWGTKEYLNLKQRFDSLNLGAEGYVRFTNVVSPAVSTIMSIESIMSGLHAAKTHKMHWRQWPSWDRFTSPVLSDFLAKRDYKVYGFSYLLDSENWLPSLYCYKPEIYKDFPSHKRDTHSHEAVLAAVRHFFKHEFSDNGPHLLIIHSIFLFDMWQEMMNELSAHGMTTDNTVFAHTADHYFPKNFGRFWLFGERDNTPLYHHSDLTEYNSRVFFHLKYPGSSAAEIDTVVSGCDIAPTLLDLLGFQEEWPDKADGMSLMPLVNGGNLQPRLIRADNVYPYQVAEKQGRVTSIRSGRFKYIVRPDPISSYITYRMSEGWSTVLSREEFYDVEADSEEIRNLIDSSESMVQMELERCRQYYRTSNEEIIRHHARTLHPVFNESRFGRRLSGTGPRGSLLCVQSCPDVVFATIVSILVEMLPDWGIDVILKKECSAALPSLRKCLRYPVEGVYSASQLSLLLNQEGAKHYDCVVNTSNVPMGDYAAVYNENCHPVGDFTASGDVLRTLPAQIKGSLSLDMNFVSFGKRYGSFLQQINPLPMLILLLSKSVPLLLAFGRRFLLNLLGQRAKINKSLAARIIKGEHE